MTSASLTQYILVSHLLFSYSFSSDVIAISSVNFASLGKMITSSFTKPFYASLYKILSILVTLNILYTAYLLTWRLRAGKNLTGKASQDFEHGKSRATA